MAADYGVHALTEGRGDPAARWLSAADALKPDQVDLAPPLQALATAYFAAGLFDRAAWAWARSLACRRENATGWNDYGVTLDRLDRAERARAAFRRALAIAPEAPAALANLADLTFRGGRMAEALVIARRAGIDAGALATAANALLRLGRPTLAATYHRRVLCVAPDQVIALTGLATSALAEEDIATAGRWLRRALAVRPDDIAANNNLATWHLTQGDLRRGFARYEWRWHRPEAGPRRPGLPEWQGEPLSGRTVLLYQEQGLGDALQAARYVPILSATGARVVVECHPALLRLFRSLPGKAELCRRGEPVEADLQAPLMSLPYLCGTTLATLPHDVPYLRPDAELVRHVAPRLAGAGRRIGLVWQGNPRQVDEPHRSIPLALLDPLLRLSGATFYALQKDHGREQMAAVPADIRPIDLGPDLVDLATTAAVLSHLDLVITTCTAVAHLAGALGRPVWVLLKRGPDWRWMLDREDSPWYPTARLLRQRRTGDWQEVATRLTGRVAEWLR